MKVHQLITGLNLLALIGLILFISFNGEKEKTAFFISSQVYNEFDLKKELEQELDHSHNIGQRTLDSLELELKMLAQVLENSEPTQDDLIVFDRKKYQYLDTKSKIEEDYSLKFEESYTQIWDRINDYSAEYGEANKYDFIFGANGDGSVMYAKETKDITDELITFINDRYAGS